MGTPLRPAAGAIALPVCRALAVPTPLACTLGPWCSASVILQAASTVISPNVEIIQRQRGSRQGVVWNRAVNIAQIATNTEDPQRFTRVPIEWRTLTLFPISIAAAISGHSCMGYCGLGGAVPIFACADSRSCGCKLGNRAPGKVIIGK